MGERMRGEIAAILPFIVTCVRELGFACVGCSHDRLELHFDPVRLWGSPEITHPFDPLRVRNCRPGAEYFPSLSLPLDHAYF